MTRSLCIFTAAEKRPSVAIPKLCLMPALINYDPINERIRAPNKKITQLVFNKKDDSMKTILFAHLQK